MSFLYFRREKREGRGSANGLAASSYCFVSTAKPDLANYKYISRILDLCSKLNGITTNCLEDYFTDADDYAVHVANYLAFEGYLSNASLSAQLTSFCAENLKEEDGENQSVGIFFDAANPILNRNILLSKLYGTEKVLSNALQTEKIKKEDILEYYSLQDQIGSYRSTGKCKTADEQKILKKYQEIKNRVECRNIVEYQEILDELQAQLIDWCYLRERDLMYFQLGFHYMCLRGTCRKDEGYKTLTDKERTIDGAILYQMQGVTAVSPQILFLKKYI